MSEKYQCNSAEYCKKLAKENKLDEFRKYIQTICIYAKIEYTCFRATRYCYVIQDFVQA